jgi:hypothetical protein
MPWALPVWNTSDRVDVRVEIPELLPELCDYLSRRGWVAVESGVDHATVIAPGSSSGFEAAMMLLADVDLWRVQRPWARVTVNPQTAD